MVFPGLGTDTIFGDGSTSLSYAEFLWADELGIEERGISVIYTNMLDGLVIDRGGSRDQFFGCHFVVGSENGDVMVGGDAGITFLGKAGDFIL